LWQRARAVERHTLLAENRRLAQAQQQQLQREQDEARKLLGEQRELVERGAPLASDESPLPKRLVEHYRELLKAYIIMGSGHLHGEIVELADLLVAAGAPARDALRLHTAVLDEVIQGLGNRSARHVMNRADLLAVEFFLELTERYRQRYTDQIRPPMQQKLPGFEEAAA
jgi:hypothetical protein